MAHALSLNRMRANSFTVLLTPAHVALWKSGSSCKDGGKSIFHFPNAQAVLQPSGQQPFTSPGLEQPILGPVQAGSGGGAGRGGVFACTYARARQMGANASSDPPLSWAGAQAPLPAGEKQLTRWKVKSVLLPLSPNTCLLDVMWAQLEAAPCNI